MFELIKETNNVTNLGGVELKYIQYKIINMGEHMHISARKLIHKERDKIITYKRSCKWKAFKMLGWVELETQRKTHKCILVFKCLNDLVPPYVSNYFIRNSTIHTHKTRQRNDIHLPNPKLTLGAVLFNDLPTTVNETTSFPF